MNSINILKPNSLSFTGVIYTHNTHKPTAYDLDRYDNYPNYSDAISSYGQAMVSKPKDPYLELQDRINSTANNESISIEDAVKEFADVECSSKKKTDYILACTYEDNSNEPEINKKALLTLKEAVITNSIVPKYTDVIRTCLDEDKREFNSTKFENMFNCNGKLKLSAKLKPRKTNSAKEMRDAKAERFIKIFNAVENQGASTKTAAGSFKISDLFVPLTKVRQDMLDSLEQVKDIPDDLRASMTDAINNDNFELRKVHSDYYSLLNDCKTISDVEMFYPELTFPKEKPTRDQHSPQSTLSNRLANEDFDGIVLDILRKSYIDIKPKDDIRIELKNSRPTSYVALNRAGYKFSYPSNELQQLLSSGDKLKAKYEEMPKLTEEEIDQSAKKHAVKQSKVWADYKEMTSSEWLPIRLIKNKRLKPKDSEYSTDKLVNTYLYNLYKRNPNGEYSQNPLEQYGNQKHLSPPAKAIINSTYISRFKRADEKANLDVDFIDFAAKFDKKAIGKSLESMENNYTQAFFRKYWTKERVGNLKNELQTSSDLIYEKILLNESVKPKKITDVDVNKLIQEDLSTEVIPTVDEDKLSRLKYLTTLIRNPELKQRCRDCISNSENVDIAYFESLYKIIQESQNGIASIDEDKAMVHVLLHDQYLHHLLNSDEIVDEKDFTESKLAQYRSESGDVNYHKMKNDTEAENKYLKKIDNFINNNELEFVSMVEDKFVSENLDYNSANHVLDLYETTPDTFKGKFVSEMQAKNKIKPNLLIEELDNLHEKIASWDYDNDTIVVMDEDKIPQKTVISHNVKKELLDKTGDNLDLFDSYYKKIYTSAQHRTGDERGQGIKVLKKHTGYDAEIKIKGNGGDVRVYGHLATDDEKQKYDTGDGINVKYIFDTCDDHL